MICVFGDRLARLRRPLPTFLGQLQSECGSGDTHPNGSPRVGSKGWCRCPLAPQPAPWLHHPLLSPRGLGFLGARVWAPGGGVWRGPVEAVLLFMTQPPKSHSVPSATL